MIIRDRGMPIEGLALHMQWMIERMIPFEEISIFILLLVEYCLLEFDTCVKEASPSLVNCKGSSFRKQSLRVALTASILSVDAQISRCLMLC